MRAKRAAETVAKSPSPAANRWLAEAKALFWKDVQAELRTKVAVSAIGVFTFSALLLITLATATLKEIHFPDPVTGNPRLAWDFPSRFVMLWVLLCFAAFTGLAHSFVHEEETGTVTALRLSLSAGGAYVGKLTYNIALILLVALLVTPLYMAITGMNAGSVVVFILTMLGGCVGLAAAATIIAALAAKARGTGALFSALGLPFMIIFVILLMNAAGAVYVREPSAVRVLRDVGGLWSYGIMLIAISTLTFPFVWEE